MNCITGSREDLLHGTHSIYTVFEGDEYHAPGFSVPKEGEIEVDDARATYLVETFGNRFSMVDGKKDAPTQDASPAEEDATGEQTTFEKDDGAVDTGNDKEQIKGKRPKKK